MNVYIDIETIPTQPETDAKLDIAETIKPPASMTKAETIADWHAGAGKYAGVKDRKIDEAYRKTALDGTRGEIICICFATDHKEYGVYRTPERSEFEMLLEFYALLNDALANGQIPYFIGHNVVFDLRFIVQRSIINAGIKPPSFRIPANGRHGSDFFCTMTAWAGFRERISLDNLSAVLRCGEKGGMSGSEVWDNYKLDAHDAIKAYCAQDVALVRDIFKRINLFV